ncbi:hypothetical protein D9M71_668600 [compost metagenome]
MVLPIDTLDEIRIFVLEIAAVVIAHPLIQFRQEPFDQRLTARAGREKEVRTDDFPVDLRGEGVAFRVRRHIQINHR